MSELTAQITAAAEFIRKHWQDTPIAGIILGSGLGNLAKDIENSVSIPYSDIPHFPVSTVEGHSGKLILGYMQGKPVVAMAGRFHFYEGFSMKQVTFPVRVMKALGIHTLFISNAAGGMNHAFQVGDLMVIKDHINLQPEHPLRGKNEDELGPRFPDMSEPYAKSLIDAAYKIAADNNISLHTGVYVGVQGPTFETRAEYKYMHIIGGDAVGMSTVPEVIVAAHAGLKVFAMSVITDIGIREEENVITHEEVLEAAHAAEPKLTLIFSELIRQL
ncbi:purine-nucleoside phosphorylase [Chitinophaga nivalis]|uniref:Purine nucleoside phosphorylase n=1 Tax=Chitinophaga nivalis TaxID=2991709 RepID=A0ABT3IRZ6_9BACT|nr:purine-nucleoside phosphorylase [Chitinophaga nivalis]MCW3463577.1 purine-nucleoside phosphorylase [Chitinophaga nivalis]MCW3486733.1 purine-nucleoside phosphorylase [Chitinophaga nivalis]